MWLAENEHVSGWLVRPLDPVAVVATAMAARRMLKGRRERSACARWRAR